MIKLTEEILNVLCMVYYGKHYYIYHNMLKHDNPQNLYSQIHDLYCSLDLPEGLDKNKMDFERAWHFDPTLEPYNTWMNTPVEKLSQFVWKN